MSQFHIVVIPGGEAWFQEIAETLLYGLRALGRHAEIQRTASFAQPRQNIVLAAHLAPPGAIPDGSILYNFEQLRARSLGVLGPDFYQLARRSTMWDYCSANLRAWQAYGVKATLVELGYVPELTRIPDGPADGGGQDIDVLFYGSPNNRRLQVVAALEQAGVRVVSLHGLFGAARDAQTARAKIVLNVHFYETKIFEIARVSYLLANRKAVVTEQSSDEADYAYLRGGVRSVPYEELVEACRELLADPEGCEELRAIGFDRFSRRSEAEILKAALSRQHSALS